MTVRFHRPTPIDEDLELFGETVSIEGRKVRSRAEIRVGGELCASSEALFIRPR
jgi:acyl-CoA thioesterase FadM